MTDEGHWHFRFEIGRPAPTAFLAPKPDMMSAGQHILQELLPGVRRHPEQCGGYLLDCFRPNVLIPGQETSVV
jgi:hypothetical protein